MRYARWAVIVMFVINGWCNAHWVARIPDAKTKLGLSEGTLGIALFSAAVGALIAQVLSGWLISKYGSRRVTAPVNQFAPPAGRPCFGWHRVVRRPRPY